jgi:hypothetical protein
MDSRPVMRGGERMEGQADNAMLPLLRGRRKKDKTSRREKMENKVEESLRWMSGPETKAGLERNGR